MADANTVKKKVVRKPAGPKTLWVIHEGMNEAGGLINPVVARKAEEVVDAIAGGAKFFKLTLPVVTRAAKAA